MAWLMYMIVCLFITGMFVWNLWDDYGYSWKFSKQKRAKITLLSVVLFPLAPFCLLAYGLYRLYKLLRWLWDLAFHNGGEDNESD